MQAGGREGNEKNEELVNKNGSSRGQPERMQRDK